MNTWDAKGVAEPFSAEFYANPHPTYEWLRRHSPVREVALQPSGLATWLITRYEDAKVALAHPAICADRRWAPADWFEAGVSFEGEDASLHRYMGNLDPPDHTRMRKLVNKAFTPARVASLRERITSIATDLVGRFADRGHADLITELAFPLPVAVISEMFGVPEQDRADLQKWISIMVSVDPHDRPLLADAQQSLSAYLADLVESKRRQPGADLTSALVAARDEDDRLDEVELLSQLFEFLGAGYETVAGTIGNGALALLQHPDHQHAVRAGDERLAAVVEECVRYDSGIEFTLWRFTSQDITIGGTAIPAGRPVLVALSSANRDPDRFTEPELFDPSRDRKGHLGFGYGPHFCIGASLAREEVRTALHLLFRSLTNVRLAVPAAELQWRMTLIPRGLAHLPVTFDVRPETEIAS